MVQIAVNEIFGPTFQGEGPSLGRKAMFLRLAMCNLKCSWCDTKYTWDWEHHDKANEVHLMAPELIAAELVSRTTNEVLVITGGEPLLQQKALAKARLPLYFRHIQYETNGTIAPDDYWLNERGVFWNVSPKLSNSGNAPRELRGVQRLKNHERAIFKFVCSAQSDLEEVWQLQMEYRLDPRHIWIMPEGTHAEDILDTMRYLEPAVLSNGYNMTTRLHVLLWGDRRGV